MKVCTHFPLFLVLSTCVGITYAVSHVVQSEPTSYALKRAHLHCLSHAAQLEEYKRREPLMNGMRQKGKKSIKEPKRALRGGDNKKRINTPGKVEADRKHFWMTKHIPTWSCPFLELVGGFRDGAKWVCDVDLIPRQQKGLPHLTASPLSKTKSSSPPCLVYSFGSNGNFLFEKEMVSRLQCEVHIFDFDTFTPSFFSTFTSDADRALVHFHSWGLGNSSSFQVDFAPFAKKKKKANATADVDTANVADWKWFYSLADIVDKLGHRGRSLQVLKVDVEGAEFGVLDNEAVWAELEQRGVSIEQILVEAHTVGVGKNYRWKPETIEHGVDAVDKMMSRLGALGYALFHKEVNLLSDKISCAEFSLVRLDLQCPESYSRLARALRLLDDKPASADRQRAVESCRREVDDAVLALPDNRFVLGF